MADPAQLAKAAREQLAAALNALQTSPDTPEALLEAAEPIAQTMGILHRIERSNGKDLEGRDAALAGVRSALDRIQQVDADHPAVEMVMEAVAGSLTKVHALVRYTPPAPAPAPAPVAVAPVRTVVMEPPPAAAPVAVVATRTVPIQAAPEPPPPVRNPTPQPMPAVVPADVARPARSTQMLSPSQPVASPAAAQHHQMAPAAHMESAAFPLIQPAQRPAGAASTQPSVPSSQVPVERPSPQVVVQPARQPAPASAPAPAQQARGAGPTVDAELGTHSASNFYKGLGGNDVIEHGGIFVATYKVMKIGSVVALRVHLPGDYEFHATAVVQWTREAGTSEPGFGARFTQISPEGRQLVYRYTRNREPMFYDDL